MDFAKNPTSIDIPTVRLPIKMIHQHIFASPRPGMSEQEFQDYWRYVHAIKYAVPIPQVRKYKIDCKMDIPSTYHPLAYAGLAEIWLNNEKEKTESVLTPEYLQGAKKDEKKWAAAWQTLVLDTSSTLLHELTAQKKDVPEYKLLVLLKRKENTNLDQFRQHIQTSNAELAVHAPGLIRNLCCFVRDRYYADGSEPFFDFVGHFSAESLLGLKEMMASSYWQETMHADFLKISDPWIHACMTVRSEWVIGPEGRG